MLIMIYGLSGCPCSHATQRVVARGAQRHRARFQMQDLLEEVPSPRQLDEARGDGAQRQALQLQAVQQRLPPGGQLGGTRESTQLGRNVVAAEQHQDPKGKMF